MQSEDDVDHALEYKNYSFSLFRMKNSFSSKDVVFEVDDVDLNFTKDWDTQGVRSRRHGEKIWPPRLARIQIDLNSCYKL